MGRSPRSIWAPSPISAVVARGGSPATRAIRVRLSAPSGRSSGTSGTSNRSETEPSLAHPPAAKASSHGPATAIRRATREHAITNCRETAGLREGVSGGHPGMLVPTPGPVWQTRATGRPRSMTVAVDQNALAGAGGQASSGGAGPNTTGSIPRIDPSLPQVFGRYLLVQRLSRGGMGEIFLAKHGLQGFEKLCVIKKVLPNLAEDESFISRFVDEAQVAIKLQHVNVAQVFEVGRVGDEYFLAIEYCEGRDLRRTLQVMARQKRRFPPELALFVAREVANGLAYAHRRTGSDGSSLNLVHCDISPP